MGLQEDSGTTHDENATKANHFLIGIMFLFFFLTFVAYLCTDGRSRFVVPCLRRCCPRHRWVKEGDGMDTKDRNGDMRTA